MFRNEFKNLVRGDLIKFVDGRSNVGYNAIVTRPYDEYVMISHEDRGLEVYVLDVTANHRINESEFAGKLEGYEFYQCVEKYNVGPYIHFGDMVKFNRTPKPDEMKFLNPTHGKVLKVRKGPIPLYVVAHDVPYEHGKKKYHYTVQPSQIVHKLSDIEVTHYLLTC